MVPSHGHHGLTVGDEGTIEKHPKSWNWMPVSLHCRRFPASEPGDFVDEMFWMCGKVAERWKERYDTWEKGTDSLAGV